ncbi:hypothetical protein [uncultured Roseobacter sp.]|uniref:hypothetical protein n=1 Tax=uncultured Roseobacter sp. TaxID=114847 RepID=UPI00261576D6|nr:hypothetical protein [uncultured Roseobacter sp.]
MSQTAARPVRRRKVFYIPGYDPFPPRRYRELYRREGAAQAEISGYVLEMEGGLEAPGRFGWRVSAQMQDRVTRSEIEVLVWSDIVQDSRTGSIPGTYLALFRTAWIYLSTGALWRLMRLRKGPVIAALYPVVMLLGQLALATLAGWLIWQLGTSLAPGVALLAAGAGGLCAVLLLRWFRDRDGRIFAYYLMHDFAHSAEARGAYPAALAERLEVFRERVAEALASDVDEVLVVGHSSGAHLAISLLAEILRERQAPQDGPALGLLSLGHVVPMVGFLPQAGALRRDLSTLAVSDRLAWIDVSAPGDGCCFALCDPVAVCGQGSPEARWPLVFSAAFTKTLSAERWKRLRRRFFRLHFQYLCAFDRPGDYDYFAITAGPVSLADRYANRTPSASRITRSLSPYTDRAP